MAMTEAPYSITFKTPKGNLFTVRGDGADALRFNLTQVASQGLLELISQIENSLAGQPRASAVAPRPAAAKAAAPKAAETPAKQDDQELPAGMGEPACETCGGPTRFDKEGLSSQSGKPYKRYQCTANQLHRATFTG